MILPQATVDGRGPVALLTAIDQAGNNLPLRRLRVIGERSVLRNFHEGGRPQRWAPLAPATIARRRKGRRRKSPRPLMDSGRLRMSVGSVNLGPSNFKVFNDLPYAAFQNFGVGPYSYLPRSRKLSPADGMSIVKMRRRAFHPGLPKREFMLWQEDDFPILLAVITDHIVKAAKKGRRP